LATEADLLREQNKNRRERQVFYFPDGEEHFPKNKLPTTNGFGDIIFLKKCPSRHTAAAYGVLPCFPIFLPQGLSSAADGGSIGGEMF